MRYAPVLPLLALALSRCSPPPTPAPPSAAPIPPASGPKEPTPARAGTPTTGSSAPAQPAPARESDNAKSSEPEFSGPVVLERLAIYPITLAVQEDIGPVIPLEEALEKGLAEVREVGAEAAIDNPVPQEQRRPAPPRMVNRLANNRESPAQNPIQQDQVQGDIGGNAQVNTLVIANRGEVPIFVLAGTIVKGGRQDRQIGQDFIVQAKQTLPVDAFCVEHGRWTTTREGAVTGGRFSAMPVLATSKVRAAGQYRKDQQGVWDEVAKTNKTHRKEAESGTLMATLDDAEVVKRTEALAGRVESALGQVTPGEHLVGLAWAVDGQLQGIRWFAHHRLFEIARAQLVRTAAVDTLTAEAAGPAPVPAPEAPWASVVLARVAEVEASSVVERRDTGGANDNEYKESRKAWGSKTMLKAKDGRKAKAVAFDYLMK